MSIHGKKFRGKKFRDNWFALRTSGGLFLLQPAFLVWPLTHACGRVSLSSPMEEAFAVIATGGKQVLVRQGQTIRVETLEGAPDSSVTFADILLTAQGDNVRIGTPTVAGARVTGTIVRHGRHKKVIGVKFKAKKRYRRKFGHRQHFTEVKISEIQS